MDRISGKLTIYFEDPFWGVFLREAGRNPEIGYGILEEYRGQGFAMEAVKLALKWAFEHSEIKAVDAEADPDNSASQRVLLKCGFRPNGEIGGEGPRYRVYGGNEMKTNKYTIRLEKEEDYRTVENLVRESFWNVYRPGCSEHYVIHVLWNAPAFVAAYLKGRNAKNFRHNREYESARWGKREDIEPYIDSTFQNNVILSQTERLAMSSRPLNPQYARNKNMLVVGGSGSGNGSLSKEIFF